MTSAGPYLREHTNKKTIYLGSTLLHLNSAQDEAPQDLLPQSLKILE